MNNGKQMPLLTRAEIDLKALARNFHELKRVTYIEDAVVIIGKQGDNEITADEVAGSIGTINYEIVSSLAPRVTRVYI